MVSVSITLISGTLKLDSISRLCKCAVIQSNKNFRQPQLLTQIILAISAQTASQIHQPHHQKELDKISLENGNELEMASSLSKP